MENLLYQRLQVREEVSAIIKRVELHLSYGPPSLVQLSSWNQYLIEKEQDLKEMDGKIEDLVAIDKIAEEIERAETWTNTIVTTRWKLGGVIKDLRSSLKSTIRERMRRNLNHGGVPSFPDYGSNSDSTSLGGSAALLTGVTDEACNDNLSISLIGELEQDLKRESDTGNFTNSALLPSARPETLNRQNPKGELPESDSRNDRTTQIRLPRTVSPVVANRKASTNAKVTDCRGRAKPTTQDEYRTRRKHKQGEKGRSTKHQEERQKRGIFWIFCPKRTARTTAVKKVTRRKTGKHSKQRYAGQIPHRLKASQRLQVDSSRDGLPMHCCADRASCVPYLTWLSSTLRRLGRRYQHRWRRKCARRCPGLT